MKEREKTDKESLIQIKIQLIQILTTQNTGWAKEVWGLMQDTENME